MTPAAFIIRLLLRRRDLEELRQWVAAADGLDVNDHVDLPALEKLIRYRLVDPHNGFEPTALGRQVAG